MSRSELEKSEKSLFEIKREMLLEEAAAEKVEKESKKASKKRKHDKHKKKKPKRKHRHKKHKHKRRKRGSSSSSSSDSDSDSSSAHDPVAESSTAGQPLRYSEMMKGSARTADGSDERVEVRYSAVSGKVISMDRRQTDEDKLEDEHRRLRLAAMNAGEDDETAEKNERKKSRKKSKKGDKYKPQMQKVAESLVENGKRAREEIQEGGYRKKMSKYRAASNDPTANSVDFATMNKDKRYFNRLKAADRASKQAAQYQGREDAKMDELKKLYGLDRLEAAANGQTEVPVAGGQAGEMLSPQLASHAGLDIKQRLLMKARERSRG